MKFGDNRIRLGTAVTRSILDGLGSPDGKLKIIHIAGTNGKGSVAEYITQILIAAGKKTGTFTSPAVFSYAEQFRVNGVPLGKKKLDKYFSEARTAAGTEATEFEIETAGAVYAFCREGCEYAVLECGMGGRGDATNAVNGKEVAVITSVGLEHTAYLGNTLQEICENKAGIIKDCPAVVSALQPGEVSDYFKDKGVIFADKPLEIIRADKTGQAFYYGGCRYEISMAGSAQPYDAAAAIEAARLLKIDESAIYSGVKAAKLGGRMQVLKAGGREYILDGAHNPAAFKPLAEFIKEQFGHVETLIFGCLSDKDIDGILKSLAGLAEKVIAVNPESPRAMGLDKISRACRKYFGNVTEEKSVTAALNGADGKTVCVCGSFTILEEAESWISKRL